MDILLEGNTNSFRPLMNILGEANPYSFRPLSWRAENAYTIKEIREWMRAIHKMDYNICQTGLNP